MNKVVTSNENVENVSIDLQGTHFCMGKFLIKFFVQFNNFGLQ